MESQIRSQMMSLLDDQVAACTRCPLNDLHYLPVPGVGSASPDLFICLEAPAEHESNPVFHPHERFGVPAIGPAGQALQELMSDIGFSKYSIYVTNTVLHHPPKNRPPSSDEKAACSHFLRARLAITRPKVILALGKHASEQLRSIGGAPALPDTVSHSGQHFDFCMSVGNETLVAKCFSALHPSYACCRAPHMKPQLEYELMNVYKYLGGEFNG